MRYTRNRQISKAMKESWKGMKNNRIGSKCNSCSELDKSFKWHREYNNVSFDCKHYYPKELTVPLYVDLYKEDSVYY